MHVWEGEEEEEEGVNKGDAQRSKQLLRSKSSHVRVRPSFLQQYRGACDLATGYSASIPSQRLFNCIIVCASLKSSCYLIFELHSLTHCLDNCAAYTQPVDRKNQKCHCKSFASLVKCEIILKYFYLAACSIHATRGPTF